MKRAIIGLLFTLVAITAFASMDSQETADPIEYELQQLTMSPGERMLIQVMSYHPVNLLIDAVNSEE